MPRDPARSAPEAAAKRFAIAVLLLGLVVALFVTARTWLLAGVPTSGPDPLFALWKLLGMHLREPAGSLEWAPVPHQWADVPVLAYDWLFRPQLLVHIVITWVGNVWFWCALFAIAAAAIWRIPGRSPRLPLPMTALILAGAVLAFGVQYAVRGSDGNYFLYALVPALVAASTWLFRRLQGAPAATLAVLACLPAFAFFQAGCSFLTTGWSTPGTRTFDVVLDRDWEDMRRIRWEKLRYAGLAQIGHYLKNAGGPARVVGYSHNSLSFWLPARFEYLPTIAISRPEYLASAGQFLAFLRDQRIDYLILPRPEAIAKLAPRMGALAPGVLAAADILAADPRTRRIEDKTYYLLDFSALHASPAAPPTPSDQENRI